MAQGTLSADGQTDWVLLPRGDGTLIVKGTWGNGTVTVQARASDGSGVTVPDYEFTEDVVTAIDAGSGVYVRLDLDGSTAPDLDWEILQGSAPSVRVA